MSRTSSCEPIVVDGAPRLGPGDAAIFFNFRPDRGRQLARKLVEAGFDLTTMTRYSDELDVPVAFGEQIVEHTLAETLAAAGARQLHVAETEKYAHVTYFFNGGVEQSWPGEMRILVPSPRDVPSYDHKPEMSAREVAARFAAEIGNGYRFAVINFANPDMVGHTGSIPAVTTAVEVTDECLGVVVEAAHAAGGVCLVTADHGNAEQMLEPDGVSPHTAHTTNPVPLILTLSDVTLKPDGELSDLAPTALRLLGLDTPSEMTGESLCAIVLSAWLPLSGSGAILRPTCRCPSLISASCGRPSEEMSELSRSSSVRMSFPSSTTCCGSSATVRSPRI